VHQQNNWRVAREAEASCLLNNEFERARGFESLTLRQGIDTPIAQWIRALAYEVRGRTFKSYWGCQTYTSVAQLAEQRSPVRLLSRVQRKIVGCRFDFYPACQTFSISGTIQRPNQIETYTMEKCDLCDELATYVRHTQFAGTHYFCTKHAEMEDDFEDNLDPILYTSEQWLAEVDIKVIDPDGWDRKNFQFSFYEEKIPKSEFNRRLAMSTIQFRFPVKYT
jgi:hypothetical protein